MTLTFEYDLDDVIPNIFVKGHFVQKLYRLDARTDTETHTPGPYCFTWTT